MEGFWKKLRDLVSEDVANRKVARLASAEEIKNAVELAIGAKKIALFTGFVTLPGVRCETDGPVGTLFMARGLIGLGKEVHVWSDFPHVEILEAGVRHLSLDVSVFDVPIRFGGNVLMCFWRERYDLLISIERPGRAMDGKYYSCRGEDVSPYVSPLDEFFIEAKKYRTATIGIGDGGNEIGMGKVRPVLLEKLPEMGRIASIVKVDHLIVSGVSNWGAYALLAGISMILGRRDVLPTSEEETKLLELVVSSGGIDGISLKSSPTVDGIPEAILINKLREIRKCLESCFS